MFVHFDSIKQLCSAHEMYQTSTTICDSVMGNVKMIGKIEQGRPRIHGFLLFSFSFLFFFHLVVSTFSFLGTCFVWHTEIFGSKYDLRVLIWCSQT